MADDKNKVRLAALSDLHFQESSVGTWRETFAEVSEKADILIIPGDLTDHGYIEEAELLAQELSYCRIPIVGVLGNHDYANNHQDEIRKILSPQQMILLGDEPCVIKDIGFAGVKGFGGGFDNHILGAFGEEEIKRFVYTAIDESLKLEHALNILDTSKKVVVIHYSPIKDTVIGEAEELYPFMGSSRLAEPIDSFNASMVFHGHAHHGTLEGKTLKGIPVFNVALNVLNKAHPEKRYIIREI